MKIVSRHYILPLALSVLLSGCTTNGGWPSAASSSGSSITQDRHLPSLVVTEEPPPEVIYRRGSRDTVVANENTHMASRLLPSLSNQHIETLVTRKVVELDRDLTRLSRDVSAYEGRLHTLQNKSDAEATEYYALVASINAELQSGTTPGNPVLTERWNAAQEKLNVLADEAGLVNELANDLANEASKASFLLESTRATYSLSGAVEEDHNRLMAVEDGVNQTIVEIDRLLNSVSDEINRRTAYLRTERANMQTLSLSVSNGELYGQNLTNSLYKKATGTDAFKTDPATGSMIVPQGRRPLVIIRFDRPNVSYEQAVYTAINQALEKYPSARFDLVAVSPTEGNTAEIAMSSTQSRKNGEAVLRSLTQMGLPVERIRLNAASSKDVVNSEVHLYIQ